jgi:hypothetical protein
MAHEDLNIDTRDEEAPDADASKTDDLAMLRRIKSWWRSDAEHRSKWEKQADFDFATAAGDQWTDEDKRRMEDSGKVPVVFNRCLTVIKSIAGSEINGRLDTRFMPRGVEDSKVNELLSAASEWMADQCDAEDEQSEAFESALICGEGWTEARYDFDENAEGKYVEEEIDPREMYPDCKARKKNYADARRVSRLRSISLTDAKAMFPDEPEEELDAAWAQFTNAGDSKGDPRPVEDKMHVEEMEDAVASDRSDVRILHIQWWEKEPYWLVAMEPDEEQQAMQMAMGQAPQEQKPEELSQEEYKRFNKHAKKAGIRFHSAKMMRRVYKQAFVGNKILGEITPTPCPYDFSFNCITGERDRKNNHFFGIVRVMRDPQMWANKMLANTLHIANTTAKGGIIAEKNAFDDEREAEDTYAQPHAITFAAENAVKEGRIMPKPGQGDPSVYIKLLEFSIASIRDVTGVNMELLGLRDANQPGILEAQRKQAAMTVLASLFNSLRHFRKGVGRVRLHFIQQYMSDGRLMRIKGEHGGEAKPLTRDATLGEYDVIVADAPTSPNQKEQTWLLIQSTLPVLKDYLTPDVILALLEYSPFPTEIVEKLREMKMKSDQANAPIQQKSQEQNFALIQGQIDKLQSEVTKNMAAAGKAQADASVAGAGVEGEQIKAQAEAQSTMMQGQAAAEKTMADAEAVRTKTQVDTQVAGQKSAQEQQVVAQQAQNDQQLTAAKVEQIMSQIAQQQEQAMTERMMAVMDQRFQEMMALRSADHEEQLSYGEQALRKSEGEAKLKIAEKKAAAPKPSKGA